MAEESLPYLPGAYQQGALDDEQEAENQSTTWADWGHAFATVGIPEMAASAASGVRAIAEGSAVRARQAGYEPSKESELTALIAKRAAKSFQEVGEESYDIDLTPAMKRKLEADFGGEEFWNDPAGVVLAQAARTLPTAGAAVTLGMVTPAGPWASVMVAALTSGGLEAAQTVDQFYQIADSLTDKQRIAQIPYYAELRRGGMPEEEALQDWNSKFRGLAPFYVATVGAALGAGGPAGQIVRGLKGVGHTGGVLKRTGKAMLEAGGTETIQEGQQGHLQQTAQMREGLQDEYDYGQTGGQAAMGGLIGAVLGLPGGLARRSDARSALPGIDDDADPTDPGAEPEVLDSTPSAEAPVTSQVTPKVTQAVDPVTPTSGGQAAPNTPPAETESTADDSYAGLSPMQRARKRAAAMGDDQYNRNWRTRRKYRTGPQQTATALPGGNDADIELALHAGQQATRMASMANQTQAVPVGQIIPAKPDDTNVNFGLEPQGYLEQAAKARTQQAIPTSVQPTPVAPAPTTTPGSPVAAGTMGFGTEATPQEAPVVEAPEGATERAISQGNQQVATAEERKFKGRKVLADTSKPVTAQVTNAQAKANVNVATKKTAEKVVKPGHRSKEELANADKDEAAYEAIMRGHEPGADEDAFMDTDPEIQTKARGAILKRAMSIVQKTEEAGVKLPERIKKTTGRAMSPGKILAVEARDLMRAFASKSKKKAMDAIIRFKTRDQVLRSGKEGAAEDISTERRVEGDTKMKGKAQAVELAANPETSTGEESLEDIAAEEEGTSATPAEGTESEATPQPKAKEALEGTRAVRQEHEDVGASTSSSARGPVKLAVPTTKRMVRNKAGEEVEEEVAKATTREIPADEKARMIAEMNAKLRGEPAPAPEVTPEVTKPAPKKGKGKAKVEEVKAKKAAKAKAKPKATPRPTEQTQERRQAEYALARMNVPPEQAEQILGNWSLAQWLSMQPDPSEDADLVAAYLGSLEATPAPARNAPPVAETFLAAEIWGPSLENVERLQKLLEEEQASINAQFKAYKAAPGAHQTYTALARRNRTLEYLRSLLSDAHDAMEIVAEYAHDPEYAATFERVAVERLEMAKEKWDQAKPDLTHPPRNARTPDISVLREQLAILRDENVAYVFDEQLHLQASLSLEAAERALDNINAVEAEFFLEQASNAVNEYFNGLEAREDERQGIPLRGKDEHSGVYFDRIATKRPTLRESVDAIRGAMSGPSTATKLRMQLLDRIVAIAGDVRIVMVPAATFAEHSEPNTGASYFSDLHMIAIPDNVYGNDAVHMIMHEGAHAAFIRALTLMPEVGRMVDRIAREFAKTATGKEYALLNADEFIAEAFSNLAFIKELARIKASPVLSVMVAQMRKSPIGQRVRTLWDALTQTIAHALGLDAKYITLFDAMLQVGAELETGARYGDARPGAMSFEELMGNEAAREADFRREGAPWREGASDWYWENLKALEGLADEQRAAAGPRSITHAAIANNLTDRGTATLNSWQRKVIKFLTLDQLRQRARGTVFEGPLDRLTAAVARQAPMRRKFRQEYDRLAQKYIDYFKSNPKDEPEFTDIALEAVNLNLRIVEGATPADILTRPENGHLRGNAANTRQAKTRAAALQARYNAMAPASRALFQEMSEWYRKAHNQLVKGSVEAILDPDTLGVALDPAQLADLTTRTLNQQLTEQDIDKNGGLLPLQIYNLLSKESEFHAVRGTYFPRMRYGDFVVVGTDKIKDTHGGTLVEQDTVRFTDKSAGAARKKAEAYIDASPFHFLQMRKIFIDANTGAVVTADEAKSLNDVLTGYDVKVQTRGVHMFESATEAAKFARENPERYDDIRDMEDRLGQNYQPHIMTGTQMATMMASLNQRTDLDKRQRELLRTVMSHAAARMLRGNRITSRRLKSQKVSGASTDFARNLLNYGDAAGRHLAVSQNMPALRAAIKEMKEAMNEYEGKDKPWLVQVHDEIIARVDEGTIEPNEPGRVMQDIMTVSFFTRLASPAYSIINGMQVLMVSAPVLGGRYGNARAYRSLMKAYADMGFSQALMGGLMNTAKAAKQWNRAGLSGTDDLLANVLKKLDKQKDGAALRRMVEHLIEEDAISTQAGFETSEAIAHGRGQWGHVLAKTDRIARQLPQAIEVINRTVTAVAAYRLARAEGKTHEQATQFAFDTVKNTQGDYTAANAPRFFNNPYLRPMVQFKKYAQLYTYIIGDMAHRAFKDDGTERSRQERKIARKQLANIFATQIAIAGALSLPGLELIKGGFMIAAALGLSGGWDDQEEKLKQIAEQSLGKDWGQMVTSGVITRAMGIDVSSRLSAADLWIYGEPIKYDAANIGNYILRTASGSAGTMLLDAVQGTKDVQNGDWAKGAGKIIPFKMFADAVKAAEDGKAPGWGEYALNTVGLKSARQAEATRARIKSFKRTQSFSDNYSKLSSDYIKAYTKGDKFKLKRKIEEHNKTAPRRYHVYTKTLDDIPREPDRYSAKEYMKGTSLQNQYAFIEYLGEAQGRALWAFKLKTEQVTDQKWLKEQKFKNEALMDKLEKDGKKYVQGVETDDYFILRMRDKFLVRQFNQLSYDKYWEENPVTVTQDTERSLDEMEQLEAEEARTGVIQPAAAGAEDYYSYPSRDVRFTRTYGKDWKMPKKGD